jgi:hypothetical protein
MIVLPRVHIANRAISLITHALIPDGRAG